MNKIRQFVTFVGTFVFVLSLAACGSAEKKTESEEPVAAIETSDSVNLGASSAGRGK